MKLCKPLTRSKPRPAAEITQFSHRRPDADFILHHVDVHLFEIVRVPGHRLTVLLLDVLFSASLSCFSFKKSTLSSCIVRTSLKWVMHYSRRTFDMKPATTSCTDRSIRAQRVQLVQGNQKQNDALQGVVCISGNYQICTHLIL